MVIRGIQRLLGVFNDYQGVSMVIRGFQWLLGVFNGYQGLPEVFSGYQGLSGVFNSYLMHAWFLVLNKSNYTGGTS